MKQKTVAEKQAFGRRLNALINDRCLSKSDIARQIWGNRPDGSARNRDLITAWTLGRTFPEPENLARLALALGMTVDDLDPPPPLWHKGMIEEVPGAPDRAFLMIAQEVPLWMAHEIRHLILGEG